MFRHCIQMSRSKTLSYLSTRYFSSKMAVASLKEDNRIVWVDLEMTGLDIEKDYILEIACIITDEDLKKVAVGPKIIIHQPDSVLNNMNSWCITQHGASGLTEASRNSSISIKEAEIMLLNFVSKYVPRNKCPLAGNSVYMDRLFIQKYMPKFNNYLHYRVIDVSTVKELAKRWFQDDYSRIPHKKISHRSMDDISESIKELKYYRTHVFKTDRTKTNVSAEQEWD